MCYLSGVLPLDPTLSQTVFHMLPIMQINIQFLMQYSTLTLNRRDDTGGKISFSFRRIRLAALCRCHYLLIVCTHVYSYLVTFLGRSMGFLPTNVFRWRFERPHVTGYATLTRRISSAPCGNTKSVTPCDPSLGEEVLGILRVGLSYVESRTGLRHVGALGKPIIWHLFKPIFLNPYFRFIPVMF
jgi:hypothetical protein